MPIWINSIRAIIALVLVLPMCAAVFIPKAEVNEKELQTLEKLTMLAVTFYFLKPDRKKEGGNDAVDKKTVQ